MELLDQHDALMAKIFEYFGYVGDWRVLPLDDARQYFWRIGGSERDGSVLFAESEDAIGDWDGYQNEIYTHRHMPKWVYRGADYTMICVDTHTDGNKFLQIFTNALERP